jgi:hypothetical protein
VLLGCAYILEHFRAVAVAAVENPYTAACCRFGDAVGIPFCGGDSSAETPADRMTAVPEAAVADSMTSSNPPGEASHDPAVEQ